MKVGHALVVATLTLGASAIAQVSSKYIADTADLTARIVGISAEGRSVWLRKSTQISEAFSRDLEAVMASEAAFGRELLRTRVEQRRLYALVHQYGTESAAVERARKRQEVDLALELPKNDRVAFGRYLESNKQRSLANRVDPDLRAQLQPRENVLRGLATAFGQVVGLSPSGMEILTRNFQSQSAEEVAQRNDRISEFRAAMGREILRPDVSRERLNALIERFALEEKAAAVAERTYVVKLALMMSDKDRQALGRYYVKENQPAKANAAAGIPYFP